MARPTGFSVVVATDGSPSGIAATATAITFPWPSRTHVAGVVARRTAATAGRPAYVLSAYDRHWALVAARTTRALARRWPDAEVAVVDDTPADAILAEAKRRNADVAVLGWRGHGAFRRLLMGSVSRAVLRRARSAVLVVRRRPRELRRFVVGADGSASARRAIELVARLAPPRGGQVIVVRVIEPATLPTLGLVPSAVGRALRREAAALARARTRQAADELRTATRRLEAGGWRARAVVRTGAPLTELLRAVDDAGAHVLVVGARGAASGLERLLLGSVAEGVLGHARVPVLVSP